jgi:hypothetical protein
MHRPPTKVPKAEDNRHKVSKIIREQLRDVLPLFDLILAGHEHTFYNEGNIYVLGTGGASHDEDIFGYLEIDVTSDGLIPKYVNINNY